MAIDRQCHDNGIITPTTSLPLVIPFTGALPMRYLPVNLDVRGKTAIVVGGGDVATRKCHALLEAGASIKVIAPALDGGLQELHERSVIAWTAREYRPGDLIGGFLAFACTPSPTVNLAVAEEAGRLGLLRNIADCPEKSSFTSPAVVSRGDLAISVSTGGKSPALAAHIRRELEARYGEEYAIVVDLLGKIREKLLTSRKDRKYNKKLLHAVAGIDLARLIRTGDTTALDDALRECLGPGFTLRELGMAQRIPHE